jgi:aspartate/methionine/tyrosine aminotransferase
VQDAGGWFISDEIYHRLTYGKREHTALEYSHDAIVINSFSKYYCMTGWRIGWMILPERLVRPAEVLSQNMFINAPAIAQHAALAALDATDELEERKAVYARNRAFLVSALPQAGFADFAPVDGAFYIYCDVSSMTDDSFDFARRILHETKVAVTPGLDFDPVNGHRYIRFSFCGSTGDMRRAVDRLGEWMKSGR